MRGDLPTGTVTFLFTDVEGSTRLLHELGAEAYAEALAEHRRVIRDACVSGGGVEVDTQGDAFFFAFPTAPGALAAAEAMTEALSSGPIAVRTGLHTGTPLLTDEGYVGDDVHRAARIASSGHGGQVLVSASTAPLVALELRDLGEHRFKDLSAPERVYQLGDGDFPPLTTLRQTNLPILTTPFLGRERELSDVLRLLEHSRLLTLTGPAGTGKTRLALQAAGMVSEGYPDGVYWVPLASLGDPDLVLPSAGQALAAKDELADHIGDKRLLVLFDNFEQVTKAAAGLADLLATCPHLDVLVTSRAPLRLTGEQEYPVPPFVHEEGVGFFLARARAVKPDFVADDAVSEICRQLDDLPLALELAAARVKALTSAQLLERLEQRLPLLTGGAHDLPERQRTLRAAIAWSYELLEPDEQRLFSRLSVFAGGCTLETAEDVAAAALDTLQSLVEKSLLRFTDERYWMLETIREYAAELLDEVDADRLLERLAGHLVDVAVDLGAPVYRGNQPAAYARLETEYPNTRASMTWALDNARYDVALELIGQLGDAWLARGHVQEAARWVDAALGHRHSVSTLTRARALIVASDVMKTSDRPEQVIEVAEELVETMIGEPDVDQLWVAAAMADLSDLARQQGDLVQARHWAERSLEFRIANGLPGARALMSLAELALEEDDPLRAEQLYQQAADDQVRSGHQSNYAHSLRGLGEAARRQGASALAARRFTEALETFARLGDQAGVAFAMQGMARVASDEGNLQRAGTLLGAAEALLREQDSGPEPDRPEPLVDPVAVEAGAAMTFEEAVAYALEGSSDA